MQLIRIKHNYVLPKQFRFFGVVSFLVGAIFFTQHIDAIGLLVLVIATLLGTLMLTSRYGLILDPSQKCYKEYTQLLWIENGTWTPYTNIEKVFINEIHESERMVTRSGAKFDFKARSFRAYLKFDGGEKIELDNDKSKERLLARVAKYNELLSTIIQDNAQ